MRQLFKMNNWKLSKKGFLDVLCLSPRAIVMFILNFPDTMLCRFNISSILFQKSYMFTIPKKVYNFFFLHFAERAISVVFDFDFV